jgi:hypothetical protein
MTVGRTPPDKNTLDSQIAGFLIQTNTALSNVATLKAFLDSQSDANLIAIGYSQGEVNTLRSAYTDAMALHDVWIGAAALTPARDLRTFAKLVWGTGT